MPSTGLVQAIGSEDGEKVVVGDNGVLTTEVTPTASDLLVVRTVYNDSRGTLTMIRQNGDTIEVTGFPTTAQLSNAMRGRKGRRGLPGRDGRDGITGNTGKAGCDGGPGPLGLDGEEGGAGEDGPDGPQGLMGRRGINGLEGDDGPDGRVGDDGVVGASGPSCIVGARGPAGPAPNGKCVESSTLPTSPATFLWVLPVTGSERPTVPRWSDVVVNVKSKTVQAMRFQQSSTFTAMFDIEATATGGSGMYEFTWTVPDVAGVKFTPSGLRLRVEYARRIPYPEYPGEIFTVKLAVRDTVRPGKPSFYASAEVRIKV